MQLNDIKAPKRSSKKRVGRGGKKGTYSGKGNKGQLARSGYSRRATFEGGRASIVAMAKKKRGFKSQKISTQIVNLDIIDKKFNSDEVVSPETLKEKGVIGKLNFPVKVLSQGEIGKKLTFKDVAVSEAARKKIEKAGGKIDGSDK